jgi:hypothetical protein
MNATMPGAFTETAEESANPALNRLIGLYERLGLDPEQANAAAIADLACEWEYGDFPG